MTNIDHWKITFETYLNDHPSTDGSHDLNHFKRVWKIACHFSNHQDDMLVILASCYLHDIVSYPKNDPRRSQSSQDAAKKARELLMQLQFPDDKIESVCHCIEAHSFSANIQARTHEAQVVQDADRLESLGAIGIARTFYVAGLMNSKLFCSDDPFAKNRSLDDKKYAIDHFRTKLLKIPSQMNTAAGRAEAQKRANVLERFLNDIQEELTLLN